MDAKDDSRCEHPTPGAGWFPDPTKAAGLRWWNGTSWTTDVHPAPPPNPSTPGHLSTPSATFSGVRGRARVIVAVLALCGAVVAVATFCLPKAWHLATEPSRVAGREYATHWVDDEKSSGVMTDLSKADIQNRCITAANLAASHGVRLENGTHLSPGRIIRGEFINACIQAAMQRVTQTV